jgi:hypothetical protein
MTAATQQHKVLFRWEQRERCRLPLRAARLGTPSFKRLSLKTDWPVPSSLGQTVSDKVALCQLGGDDLSGNVKLKVEPLPNSLVTQILPPCSSTNFLASVNPSPVPSTLCA